MRVLRFLFILGCFHCSQVTLHAQVNNPFDDIPEWFVHPKPGEYVGVSVPMENEKLAQQSAEFSALMSYMISLKEIKSDSLGYPLLYEPNNQKYNVGKIVSSRETSIGSGIKNNELYDDAEIKSKAFIILYANYEISRKQIAKDGTTWVSIQFNKTSSKDNNPMFSCEYSCTYSNGERVLTAILKDVKKQRTTGVFILSKGDSISISEIIANKEGKKEFLFTDKLHKMDKQVKIARFSGEWTKIGYDSRGVSSECGIISPKGAGYLTSIMNLFDDYLASNNDVYSFGLQNVGNYFFNGNSCNFFMPIETAEDNIKQKPSQYTKPNDNTFAVIIGNEKYLQADSVPFAINDSKSFMTYCQDYLNIPKNQIAYYENATYGIMRSAVKRLKEASTAYKGDLNVMFYYAGHGIPDEETKTAYLLPTDADGTIPEVCYNLDQLYSELGGLKAKQIVVFLDACFSGSKRSGGMLKSARGVAIKSKPSKLQGNMVVFSAASGEQTALPYKKEEHGLFTYYLLNKLEKENGDVTLGDLADYINDMVSKTSITDNQKVQTPTVSYSLDISDRWSRLKLK